MTMTFTSPEQKAGGMIAPSSVMKRTVILLVFLLAVICAERLPAPIVEESATPTPGEQAKPRKAKRRTVESESKTKSEASEPAATPVRRQRSSRQSRFAGTWVGTMPTIPWGNLPSVVTVDPTETRMAVSWYEAEEPSTAKTYQHFKATPENEREYAAANPAFAEAHLDGDTLTASYPAALLGTSTWSIIPQPDGITARVRMQAFMNDFRAIFHRVVATPSAASAVLQPATVPITASPPKSGGLPIAKPVPDKPGFVYNPFDPNSKVLLDVRGRASGTKLKDPFSGKLFIVP